MRSVKSGNQKVLQLKLVLILEHFSPCHIFCTLLKWNSCSPVQQLLDECKWIPVAITCLGEASFLLSGFKMENDVEGNVKDDWLLLRVTLAHLHTEECC